MSTVSEISPRFSSGELGIKPEAKSQGRRRSIRLSITNWRTCNISEGSITHVDVFLGSLTSTSEQLASSFAERAKLRGAHVTMRPLESFVPEQYIVPNSEYRSRSRLTVFVVSTHAAGKPSPNAEKFLQWLRDAPTTVHTQQSGQTQEPDAPATCSPPKNSSPNAKNQSPREHRINSSKPEAFHRHHSLSDAFRASFHVKWRHPFGGGESSMNAAKLNGPLLGVQYAVFGVGNSVYRTYNATAKYIDLRLHELGGVRVCPLGLGDVSKGIESVFTKWESQLLQVVSYQLNSTSVSAPNTAREPTRPPSRMSLPCATGNAGISVEEIVAGQSAMLGPTPEDLKKLPQAEMSARVGSKVLQRRYSSATTMIYARRASPDPMPPLTDRR